MKGKKACLVLVLVLIASSGYAATVTVDWSGSGDHLTIQDGLNDALAEDTVLVLPGTYTGADNRDLDFLGKNIVLVSQSGFGATAIDCQDAGRGFLFHGPEDTTAVVRGFTITGGAAEDGAGALCQDGSSPRFDACFFYDNRAQNQGGGFCCIGSSPVIENCIFESNTADDTGGSKGRGGGMACVSYSYPRIENTVFLDNVARATGGGLYTNYGPVRCGGCTFAGNNILNVGYDGAGAYLSHSDNAVFTYCTFLENGTASTAVGGGMQVYASSVTVSSCDFLDNRGGNGGGIQFTSGSGGVVSGCTFAGNETVWSAAGGISCVFNSNPAISSCTFALNGGIQVWCDGSSPSIEYSILAFAVNGVPVSCQTGTETPHIHHCFVYGNDDGDTLCGGNFHDIENENPLFCDAPGGYFYLCADSPCIAGATWAGYVGAHGEGCPACGPAVEPIRWGTIKAMYE
jgi:hypothetical protein